eukprot:ANDGO_03016.mRNA.1 hypothetical protein
METPDGASRAAVRQRLASQYAAELSQSRALALKSSNSPSRHDSSPASSSVSSPLLSSGSNRNHAVTRTKMQVTKSSYNSSVSNSPSNSSSISGASASAGAGAGAGAGSSGGSRHEDETSSIASSQPSTPRNAHGQTGNSNASPKISPRSNQQVKPLVVPKLKLGNAPADLSPAEPKRTSSNNNGPASPNVAASSSPSSGTRAVSLRTQQRSASYSSMPYSSSQHSTLSPGATSARSPAYGHMSSRTANSAYYTNYGSPSLVLTAGMSGTPPLHSARSHAAAGDSPDVFRRLRALEDSLAECDRNRVAERARNAKLQSKLSSLEIKHRETQRQMEDVNAEYKQYRSSQDMKASARLRAVHSKGETVIHAPHNGGDVGGSGSELYVEELASALEKYDSQCAGEFEYLRTELDRMRRENARLRDEAEALTQHVQSVNESVVDLARKLAELEGEVAEEAEYDGQLHESLINMFQEAQSTLPPHQGRDVDMDAIDADARGSVEAY